MIKNKIVLVIFTVFLPMVLLSSCSTIKKAKVVLPASWVNMEKISKTVYVDKKMQNQQRFELLEKIPLAKTYVKNIWGEVKSTPTIYACSTEVCFKNLGGGARAHEVFNYLVLSPRALTTELISHEWPPVSELLSSLTFYKMRGANRINNGLFHRTKRGNTQKAIATHESNRC